MDPIAAGALLAPTFIASDIVASRYWKASTWSKPDLVVLLPGQVIGMGLGFAALSYFNPHLIAVAIAVITLAFTVTWFKGGSVVERRPRSRAKGVLAGMASGMGSMMAHAGGPPVAMYLLPLGLSKSVYAGPTFLFFVVGNLLKVGPWLALATPSRDLWILMGLCFLTIPLGVWTGWHLHERLNERQLYATCYALLIVVAAKLLWDGLTGYFTGH
jgi:uncharacterized protein